jgi:phospholipase C
METVFNRLSAAGKDWRVYFHDIPQSVTLSQLWFETFTHFRDFEDDFARDAAAGNLPAYSFIEPRYFADTANNKLPSDEHPPHNVAYGEALIANAYNAVRAGPGWKHTLLIVTYDEHGGCFDHVVPPRATPPDERRPDGYDFSQFGVRVPAVIISPYVRPGSVIRPTGTTPFDHTSILATLRKLFGFRPLTARDAAAPDLLPLLSATPDNDGPAAIVAPAVPPAPEQVARSAAKPLNDMQKSLTTTAVLLPTAGAEVGAHVQRLSSVPDPVPVRANVGAAAEQVTAHMQAFLGTG